jgi:hypothetical protein
VNKLREADTVVDALGKAILDAKAGLSSVPGLVLRVIDEGLWRERIIVRTGELVRFESFTDFVTAPPLEGLGADLKMLRRICQDNTEALSMLDEVSQRGPGASEGNQDATRTMTLPTEVPALAHALQRRLSPEEISDLIDHLK